jgi:hypothetical protein
MKEVELRDRGAFRRRENENSHRAGILKATTTAAWLHWVASICIATHGATESHHSIGSILGETCS